MEASRGGEWPRTSPVNRPSGAKCSDVSLNSIAALKDFALKPEVILATNLKVSLPLCRMIASSRILSTYLSHSD